MPSTILLALLISMPNAISFTSLDSSAVAVDGGLSRGVAWGDMDGDGLPDLIVANTVAQPEALYRNRGSEHFTQLHQIPVTMSGGFDEGVQWVDFDNDGNLDLFVASTRDRSRLYRNDGEGHLQPIEIDTLTETGGVSEGCWADYDGDGFLDVFLARRDGEDSLLFRNIGGEDFEPVNGPWTGNGGDARACAWGDADGDGHMDLYVANFVANRGDQRSKHRNYFYRNRGSAGFVEHTEGEFVTRGGLSYGLSWVDYDYDGDLDLFVTNISSTDRNWLFENNGEGKFALRSDVAIVADSRGPSKGHVWGDLDNDGDLDLYVANGTAGTEDVENFDVRNFLYIQKNGVFNRIEAGAVTSDRNISAGVALADFDRDGDLDLYVANWRDSDEDNSFYRNDSKGGRWLALDLVGTSSNRDAIGAMVRITTVDPDSGSKSVQTRANLPRQGYGSQNEPIIHFGLGPVSRVESLEIRWPSGQVDRHGPLTANCYYVAKEGADVAVDQRQQSHMPTRCPVARKSP